MKILVLNGPNLNMLGIRDHKHYGGKTLEEINNILKKQAGKDACDLIFFQSNHEGKIVDYIQENRSSTDGILINPGALTHYGYSLRDALSDTKLPIIEVHLSDVNNREPFRKIDVLDGIVIEKIVGLKEKSYIFGLAKLIAYLKKNK